MQRDVLSEANLYLRERSLSETLLSYFHLLQYLRKGRLRAVKLTSMIMMVSVLYVPDPLTYLPELRQVTEFCQKKVIYCIKSDE